MVWSTGWLRLRKRQWLALRQRHAKHVKDHGDQHVVAQNSHELDCSSVAEHGMDASEITVTHGPCLIELLNKVVDRALVLRCRLRRAPPVDLTDGFLSHAGARGLRHMGVPFVLRPPELCRQQHGKFRKAWRHGGVEAAMATQLLS